MQSIGLIFMVCQLAYLGNSNMSANYIRIRPKEREDETLLHGRTTISLFGGPIVKFTEINDDFAVLVGGRGGLIINHAFSIGGGGYGLVNNIMVDNIPPRQDYFLEFGYGGLVLEYILRSRKLLHLSVYTLIGGGSLCYRDDWYEPWDDDAFFVDEPGLDLMLNVTKCFRIGIGGSYRFITGVGLDGLTNKDVSGATAGLTFKFGRF